MAALRRRVVLAAGIGTAFSVPRVNAQADWPKGPIKFIVPFSPGAGTDPIARITASFPKAEQDRWFRIIRENNVKAE